MQEVIKKMITEAMAAQHADVNQIKKKRGQKFVIDDTKAYVDAVKGMKPAGAQSKAVFALHKDSVNAHYTILKSLTTTIRPRTTHLSSTTRHRSSWRFSTMRILHSKRAWTCLLRPSGRQKP